MSNSPEIDQIKKVDTGSLERLTKLKNDFLPSPKLKRVELPKGGYRFEADVSPGFFEMLYAWAYYSLRNDTLKALKGETSLMESKPFYLSKTFWVNILGVAWTWLGPVLGIPVLDETAMVTIFGVLNVLLRLITKKPVSIS